MSSSQPHPRLDQIFKILVVLAISIYGLVLLRDIAVPIAFAAIFTVVLAPFALRFAAFNYFKLWPGACDAAKLRRVTRFYFCARFTACAAYGGFVDI